MHNEIVSVCRQSDPISPYLFVLAITIFAVKIRLNNDTKYIKIRTRNITYPTMPPIQSENLCTQWIVSQLSRLYR